MAGELFIQALDEMNRFEPKDPGNRFNRNLISREILRRIAIPAGKEDTISNELKLEFAYNLIDFLKSSKFVNGDNKLTRLGLRVLKTKLLDIDNDVDEKFSENYRKLVWKSGVFFEVGDKGQSIFRPHLMARFLKRRSIYRSALDGEMFYYHDGIYLTGAETLVRRECEFFYDEISAHHKNEVIAHIRDSTYFDRKEIDSNPFLIHLQSGIFDLKEKELMPFVPTIISLTKLPVKYCKGSDCPLIKQFISEIVSKDAIPLIQEIIGYCLFKSYPIHKAMMLIGEGRNGKSTFINLVKEFLGDDNVTSIGVQSLETRFAPASLDGKMANLYPDIPSTALRRTGMFKILTGGDSVGVEKKFKELFTFTNYAKFIFSCNQLPEAKDTTKAFFRRWILVNFPNEFVDGENADPDLLDKLMTPEELSGLFNWAIEGLERLLKNRRFSHDKSVDEIQDQYERLSNSLLAFIKDRIVVDTSSWISKEEFYKSYAEYCRAFNIPVKTKIMVGRELPQHVSVREAKHRVDGKNLKTWHGIMFGEVDQVALPSYLQAASDEVSNPALTPEQAMTFIDEGLGSGKEGKERSETK